MGEIQLVKSRKTGPDEKSWLEYLLRAEQEIPNRIEDAAKFLATMITVSLSFFLAIGKSSIENTTNPGVKLAVLLWIVAMLLAFLVLLPTRYKLNREVVAQIQEMHRKIVVWKRLLLTLSVVFYVAAMTILSFLFFLQ